MRNLMRAFFFKLSKDWTFRITAIIGLGLALMLTFIYFFIDHGLEIGGMESGMFCTGQNLFYACISPSSNFGLAVPVNLICFTVLEFNHGTIRNKIIAGNSKGKIYLSLLLSGLIFTLVLMTLYVGLCVGLASILGGFDVNGTIIGTALGTSTADAFWKTLVLTVLAYALITFIAVFFASLFRGIGPCIPVVLLLVVIACLSATIIGPLAEGFEELQGAAKVLKIINPFYTLSYIPTDEGKLAISNSDFITEIINTVVYSALFIGLGFVIFKKRDVK